MSFADQTNGGLGRQWNQGSAFRWLGENSTAALPLTADTARKSIGRVAHGVDPELIDKSATLLQQHKHGSPSLFHVLHSLATRPSVSCYLCCLTTGYSQGRGLYKTEPIMESEHSSKTGEGGMLYVADRLSRTSFYILGHR